MDIACIVMPTMMNFIVRRCIMIGNGNTVKESCNPGIDVIQQESSNPFGTWNAVFPNKYITIESKFICAHVLPCVLE
jgi:hypothetical protein